MLARTIGMMRIFGMLFCALMIAAPLHADEIATSGRTIAAKWKDALVTVKVAAKISVSYDGENSVSEEKMEATGVIIDPSGLIVASLASADPAEYYSRMMGEETEGTKVKAEITDMNILLNDGTEIPGKIVLSDADRDLAFIRPTTKLAKPLAALDLSKNGQPELLDQVIVLYRLGVTANRALNATVDRIEAIIEKPRKQYVMGVAGTSADNGAPVFTLDGQMVGVLLCKTITGANKDGEALYIVLPAADIAEVAAQELADAK